MAETFNRMLEKLAPEAAQSEFHLARKASHLAKVARSEAARKILYAIKTRAVGHAVLLSPNRTYVGDCTSAHIGLIGVGFARLGQLHVPLRDLDTRARRIVERKLVAANLRLRPTRSRTVRDVNAVTLAVAGSARRNAR